MTAVKQATRDKIIDTLSDAAMTPIEIALASGLAEHGVASSLRAMHRDGIVRAIKPRGSLPRRYRVAR